MCFSFSELLEPAQCLRALKGQLAICIVVVTTKIEPETMPFGLLGAPTDIVFVQCIADRGKTYPEHHIKRVKKTEFISAVWEMGSLSV